MKKKKEKHRKKNWKTKWDVDKRRGRTKVGIMRETESVQAERGVERK